VDKSQAILQNDSGIPLKMLQDNFKSLQLFGDYNSPYGKEFAGYTQSSLSTLYKQEKHQEVPFCFGYGCRRVPANLMIALKQEAPNQAPKVEDANTDSTKPAEEIKQVSAPEEAPSPEPVKGETPKEDQEKAREGIRTT
jgi:hypothetical protein